MQKLYDVSEISRQGFHKRLIEMENEKGRDKEVVEMMQKVRKDHRRMSCRKIYSMIGDPTVGRDKFIKIGFQNGYKVKIKRNVYKTTISQKKKVYPNELAGKELNDINQAWSADIFYVPDQQGKVNYGIKIMDVYSRRILVVRINKRQTAKQTSKAILAAIAIREKENTSVRDCIFHSDRGSQFGSDLHEELLSKAGMTPSMGYQAQENPYSERTIGIFKNEYYFELLPDCKGTIQDLSRRIINLYNNERPHEALNMMTPTEFEGYIHQKPKAERPKELVYEIVEKLSPKRVLTNKKKKEAKKKKLPLLQ